jgi:SAM-dependent methyltransferase
MSVYTALKSIYRGLGSPFSKTLFNGRSPFSKAVISYKSMLETKASHDEVYDRAYYLKYAAEVSVSAKAIADYVVSKERPRSCIDVGCGSGEVLQAISALGVSCVGFDNSLAALELCRAKGLMVEKLDLESEPRPDRQADVVVSTEVAEHIPERFADAYVGFLAGTAPVVYMTAATPGQGGTDHVNEQPNEYWIGKFEKLGFAYAEETSEVRQKWLSAGVDRHRAKNLLIFRR